MQIKTILHTLIQPFTSVEYYKKAVHKSVVSTVVVVAITLLAMALVSGFHFLATQLPVIENSVQHIITNITDHYPENLIFEWNGTELTANTDSIIVPWPEDDTLHIGELPKHFLFYTNSQQTPSDLGISPTEYLAFVNTHEIYRMNSEKPEKWTSESLSNFIGVDSQATIDTVTVNQLTQTATNYMQTHQQQIKIFTLFLIVLLFLGSKIWFLLIETVLAVLLFKLYSIKLTAQQTVILSLHVLIPTVVLTTAANLLYQDIPFPIQTLTFWTLILFLSFQFKQKREEE